MSPQTNDETLPRWLDVNLTCFQCRKPWTQRVTSDGVGISLQHFGRCPHCGADFAYDLLVYEQQRDRAKAAEDAG